MDKKIVLEEILKDVESDLSSEEIMHILLEKKVSDNTRQQVQEHYTTGQRAADSIAKFAGSWTFIFCFGLILAIWMAVNVMALKKAFDPYPFILLNLVLSCIAAIQAPLIMMSQNRKEQKDRKQAENDYIVNLKSEFILEDLHEKIDMLLKNQELFFNKKTTK